MHPKVNCLSVTLYLNYFSIHGRIYGFYTYLWLFSHLKKNKHREIDDFPCVSANCDKPT